MAARSGWTALTLVSRAILRAAVWVLALGGKLEEAKLANLHSRPKLDWQGCGVGKLKCHVALEAWVNKSCGGVSQEDPGGPDELLPSKTSCDVIW